VIALVQRHAAVVCGVTLRGAETRLLGYLADFTSGSRRTSRTSRPGRSRNRSSERLAGESVGSVFLAEESGEPRAAFERIAARVQEPHVITYMPRGVEAAGWHPLQVSLKGRSGRVTARRGYLC